MPKCDAKGCTKYANFGLPTDKRATRCKIHADAETMIDIISIHCDFPGCTTRSAFGLPTDKRPSRCKLHADAMMIDIVHIRCSFPGCVIQPAFGLPTDKRPSRCKLHTDAMMIDIISVRCNFPGCMTRPAFGLPTDKRASRCQIHADAETMIDIVSKRCTFPGCNTFATFNLRGIRPQFCAKHCKIGMVYHPAKQCDICRRNLAEYGDPKSEIPSHCEQHQLPTEINFAQRVCKSCNMSFVLNEQNLCQFCGRVQSTHLVKQTEIEKYLKAHLPADIQQKWKSTDTTIDHGACGKERPDFLFDAGTHIVIVECDEHQHNSYPCECEQARMVNIANGLYMHTIFIRYNPDNYKYSAEYSASKRMTPKVRHDLLIRVLSAEIERDIAKIQPIEVIYICYDGCDVSCVSKHTILRTSKEEEIISPVIQTTVDPQNEAPQA